MSDSSSSEEGELSPDEEEDMLSDSSIELIEPSFHADSDMLSISDDDEVAYVPPAPQPGLPPPHTPAPLPPPPSPAAPLPPSQSLAEALALRPPPPTKFLHTGLPILEPVTVSFEDAMATDGGVVRAVLDADGVVVVTGVVSDADCDTFVTELEDVLETFPEVIDYKKNGLPGSQQHHLLKHYGIAWALPCQNLRTNPRVVALFEKIYRKPVCASVDAAAYCPDEYEHAASKASIKLYGNSTLQPHQDAALGVRTSNLGDDLRRVGAAYHSCVQGSVVCRPQLPVFDNGAYYAPPGFTAAPMPILEARSHLKHNPNHFSITSPERYEGCIGYIPVPKGAVVLWLSTTIHGNYGAADVGEHGVKGRACLMVSMLPKDVRKPEERERKLQAFKEGQSTSHHAHVCEPCGPGHMSNRAEGHPRHCKTHKPPYMTQAQRDLL